MNSRYRSMIRVLSWFTLASATACYSSRSYAPSPLSPAAARVRFVSGEQWVSVRLEEKCESRTTETLSGENNIRRRAASLGADTAQVIYSSTHTETAEYSDDIIEISATSVSHGPATIRFWSCDPST